MPHHANDGALLSIPILFVMRIPHKVFGVLVIIAGMAFSGCASVHVIKSVQSSPAEFQGNAIHVIEKTTVRNIPIMQRMQYRLGTKLTSMDYIATNCLQLDSSANDSVYIKRLFENNKGLLLIVDLIEIQQDTAYFQVNSFPVPEPPGGDRYIGYIADLSDRIFQASRFIADTRYIWECRMYDITNKQLLYGVTAIIDNPFSDAAMISAYSKFITKDMTEKQLLQSHYQFKKLPF